VVAGRLFQDGGRDQGVVELEQLYTLAVYMPVTQRFFNHRVPMTHWVSRRYSLAPHGASRLAIYCRASTG